MGFFDNYFGTKPGKGVSKEDVIREREKVTFSGFFKILKRKFWQLIQLNLLSFIFFLPLLAVFVFFVSQFIIDAPQVPLVVDAIANKGSDNSYVALWNILNISSNQAVRSYVTLQDIISRLYIGIFFTAIPLIALGPIQAGFTHILQSFIREKPVFLTSDFFRRAKTNFWQALAVSVIDLIIASMMFLALYFYNQKTIESPSVLWTIGLVFMAIILVVYLVMHLYIYPLLVTFNVNMKQLYKNSFFLAMTSFFPSLIILAINAAVIFAAYTFSGSINIVILILAGILFSFIGLINNYFSHKYIKFHLLDPALAAAEKKKNEEAVFSD